MTGNRYDIIVIGTGPGGASLAQRLAPTGKRILLLERGDYLPSTQANWDAQTVFVDGAYQAQETWYGRDGRSFRPGLHYYVGGNSKVYGAALLRLRERDFDEIRHQDGISPAWPLTYADYEPYYTEAEKLYQVHGKMGIDPMEPFRTEDYSYPPVSHEPRIQELHDALIRDGHQPFNMPIAIKLNEADRLNSPCIRCNTCDGYPCMIHAKSDADINCVRPSLAFDNVTLLINAKAERLVTTADGKTIDHIE